MRDVFSRYHPLVNFVYFTLMLAGSTLFLHPVCLGVSLLCAASYSLLLDGARALLRKLVWLLPMLLAAALLGAAFNHEGATILAYLPDGNPLTLESVCYGLAAGGMLVAAVLWFSCYNAVMTSDKFIYLFGRVAPAMSLVLSMTLRFVPRFRARLTEVSDAQRGVSMRGGRVRRALDALSALTTWALESSVETADSMRSRGYGLPGRTAFSLYRLDGRDRAALLFFLCCGGYLAVGALLGGLSFRYFPTLRGVLAPYPVSLFLCYLMLGSAPVYLNRREARKWRALSSEI